ncbi:MAG: hypothetical protein AB7S26_04035 [Sandaracinaceae bacterium]
MIQERAPLSVSRTDVKRIALPVGITLAILLALATWLLTGKRRAPPTVEPSPPLPEPSPDPEPLSRTARALLSVLGLAGAISLAVFVASAGWVLANLDDRRVTCAELTEEPPDGLFFVIDDCVLDTHEMVVAAHGFTVHAAYVPLRSGHGPRSTAIVSRLTQGPAFHYGATQGLHPGGRDLIPETMSLEAARLDGARFVRAGEPFSWIFGGELEGRMRGLQSRYVVVEPVSLFPSLLSYPLSALVTFVLASIPLVVILRRRRRRR